MKSLEDAITDLLHGRKPGDMEMVTPAPPTSPPKCDGCAAPAVLVAWRIMPGQHASLVHVMCGKCAGVMLERAAASLLSTPLTAAVLHVELLSQSATVVSETEVPNLSARMRGQLGNSPQRN